MTAIGRGEKEMEIITEVKKGATLWLRVDGCCPLYTKWSRLGHGKLVLLRRCLPMVAFPVAVAATTSDEIIIFNARGWVSSLWSVLKILLRKALIL